MIGHRGPGPIFAVAHAPEVIQGPIEQLDETIGDLSAAIETLVDDEGGLVDLAPKLAHQFGLATAAGVRNINVPHFAVGGGIDLFAIGFDPRQVAQPRLAGEGLHQNFAGAFL